MRNYYALLVLLFISCSPKIRQNITNQQKVIPHNADVFVYTVKQQLPEGSIRVGDIVLGDTGFTVKCNYDTMVEKAKLEARKVGANIVKIVEHKKPSAFGSSCHRIKAQLYFSNNFIALKNSELQKEPELLDVNYALLHVYRYSGTGSLLSYNLHLGDSVLCRVQSNFKTTIKLTEKGLNKIWAKTESKVELPIDVVHGKHYYLRCGIKYGMLVGKPSLEFVDYHYGKQEFESFEAKHPSK